MIAEFITSTRENQNISQERLAELSGVHVNSIRNIEAEKKVRINTLRKVVAALGYKVEEQIKFVPIEKK